MNPQNHSRPGVFQLQSDNHCSVIMKAIDEQRRRNDKALCDVTLVVEGKRLFAHKAVLAASSDFFKTRFSEAKNPAGSNQVVLLPGIKLAAFSQVLEYMYLGSIQISETNICDLVFSACLLQVS